MGKHFLIVALMAMFASIALRLFIANGGEKFLGILAEKVGQ